LQRWLTKGLGAPERTGVTLASAGTHAVVGSLMAPNSRLILEGLGIEDRPQHIARQLTMSIIKRSDLILTLSPEHRRFVIETEPSATKRTFTLLGFAATIARIDDDALVAALHDDVVGSTMSAAATVAQEDPLADLRVGGPMIGAAARSVNPLDFRFGDEEDDGLGSLDFRFGEKTPSTRANDPATDPLSAASLTGAAPRRAAEPEASGALSDLGFPPDEIGAVSAPAARESRAAQGMGAAPTRGSFQAKAFPTIPALLRAATAAVVPLQAQVLAGMSDEDLHVIDPIGQPMEVYQQAADEILPALDAITTYFRRALQAGFKG
jgi:protein-tyrosine-phosphatase